MHFCDFLPGGTPCSASVVRFYRSSRRVWLDCRNDISELKLSREGLVVKVTGKDPFIRSPRGDYASEGQLTFTGTLRSPSAGWGQVFYSKESDREVLSAHFPVREGWNDVCVPLPPMGAGWRLRLDFPNANGECVVARAAVEEAGARGVTRVRADKDQIGLDLRGLTGPIEIAEIEPFQTFSDARTARVVWQGDAAARITIPRLDESHDRLPSGFVAMVRHPVLGKIPAGAARFVEDFAGIAKDTREFPKRESKKGLQIQMADDAIALGVRHAGQNVSVAALFDPERKAGNPTWTVDGETFAFRKSYLDSLAVKRLSDAGMNVYLIVLGYESSDAAMNARLLHPWRDEKLPEPHRRSESFHA